MLDIHAKLPAQGLSIFSTMSNLAQQLNALNLSQGFPDFPPPAALLDALSQATHAGFNQYPSGDGYLPLREQLAQQFLQRDQLTLDPISEITITPGATLAIFSIMQTVLQAGDEVIIFDPSYDSYAPCIKLLGAKAVHIPLNAPDFQVDWNRVKDAIHAKTRMIIINTPHNPTGTVWSAQDWQHLIDVIQEHNIVVLSDEVYEHLVFDTHQHRSVLSFPELRERSFVVGSFGKTFHVTGWKTGYCVAAPELMRLFRQVYQFASFCGNTPCQVALSQFMQQHPEHIQQLASFYQQKRDQFNVGLAQSKFMFSPTQGTYFQNVDYSQIRPELNDVEMCQWLAEQHKVVAIPISVFYAEPPQNLRLLRFCFAKTEQTIAQACEILAQVR